MNLLAKMIFIIFFRPLFHLCGYFFMLRFVDSSKEYKPDTKILFDIPSAVSFFGLNPMETKKIVGEKVRTLVKAWNHLYEKKKNVIFKNEFFNKLFINLKGKLID